MHARPGFDARISDPEAATSGISSLERPGQLLEACKLHLRNRLDMTFSSNAQLLVLWMAAVRIGT
jgi:hypothetical protein